MARYISFSGHQHIIAFGRLAGNRRGDAQASLIRCLILALLIMMAIYQGISLSMPSALLTTTLLLFAANNGVA